MSPSSKNIASQHGAITAATTTKKERVVRGLFSVSVAVAFLAVSTFCVSKPVYADNDAADLYVLLKINKTTGKIDGVYNKDGSDPTLHGNGTPRRHKEHNGEPIPIVMILGMHGSSGDGEGRVPTSTCPSGFTHMIIGGLHYCL